MASRMDCTREYKRSHIVRCGYGASCVLLRIKALKMRATLIGEFIFFAVL